MSQAQPDTPEPAARPEAEAVDAASLPVKAVHWTQRRRQEQMAAFVPEIIRRISEGETLSFICRMAETVDSEGNANWTFREPGSFPNRLTFYDWCEYDPDVAKQFARARMLGVEALRDQCRAIADDSSQDWIPTPNGRMLDAEHVQRSKLRIWERQQTIAQILGGSGRQLPGDKAAAGGIQKPLPPAIHFVGIEPKGQHQPGAVLDGEAVRVKGEDDDE